MNPKRNRQRHKEQLDRIVEIFKEFDPDLLNVGTLSKEDGLGPKFSIEHKGKKEIPKWIKDAYAQTRPEKNKNKICFVTLHEHGKRHEDDFVIVPIRWFVKLLRAFFRE